MLLNYSVFAYCLLFSSQTALVHIKMLLFYPETLTPFKWKFAKVYEHSLWAYVKYSDKEQSNHFTECLLHKQNQHVSGICWEEKEFVNFFICQWAPWFRGWSLWCLPREEAVGRCKNKALLRWWVHCPYTADEITHVQVPLLHPPFVLLSNEIRLISRTVSAVFIIIFQKLAMNVTQKFQ